MRSAFNATAPAAYTSSFAATLTVAAILGVAAGPNTARAWDRQVTDAAMSRGVQHDVPERDLQLQDR
jgi:hypothetical protein